MNELHQDPSSFRDPAGSIFINNNHVYRIVKPQAEQDFKKVLDSGIFAELITAKQLLGFDVVDKKLVQTKAPDAALVLEHPKIPFITYPYEWSFQALKQAALLQLDIHLKALEKNITLIDATPYNIQFVKGAAIFIDHLSFRPYKEGDIWWGHRQFCEQFLNPLLLAAYCGIPFQDWYRGSPEGIPINQLSRTLPLYRKLSLKIFFHIVMQARLQNKTPQRSIKNKKKVRLPKTSLINLLKSMQQWIKKLEPKITSHWLSYGETHSYSQQAYLAKEQLVAEFCQQTQANTVWDLGCNQGNFAILALKSGATSVVGFDADSHVLDLALKQAQKEKLNFLPLYCDLANPSPGQGWLNQERESLLIRNSANAIFALALLHHLVISHNVPLAKAINFLLDLAPHGLIEFIPKTDPMVQQLLHYREDIFTDYTLENCEQLLQQKTTVIKKVDLPESQRIIFWYQR